ncbi:uncharacterized protein BDZ99DRAFT_277360 [Mytilinidion resinicola]|uniref:Uncharacterized protein n=1 Tax=Mytilinidion resinicola TaxID=574789 RepID=A0A6A6YSM6_9PEZI|nr:uncharacterized protein BDZ99DRAFT_277360 [Mytilinidion resinicola]KAF2811558.1 hypothetical protein BDZ99DRAFT_277360 [Mytilinidion resinicola]
MYSFASVALTSLPLFNPSRSTVTACPSDSSLTWCADGNLINGLSSFCCPSGTEFASLLPSSTRVALKKHDAATFSDDGATFSVVAAASSPSASSISTTSVASFTTSAASNLSSTPSLSPSAPSSTPSPSSFPTSSRPDTRTLALVIVIGALSLLTIIAFILFCLRRRRQSRSRPQTWAKAELDGTQEAPPDPIPELPAEMSPVEAGHGETWKMEAENPVYELPAGRWSRVGRYTRASAGLRSGRTSAG